jgi:hypothetical protein
MLLFQLKLNLLQVKGSSGLWLLSNFSAPRCKFHQIVRRGFSLSDLARTSRLLCVICSVPLFVTKSSCLVTAVSKELCIPGVRKFCVDLGPLKLRSQDGNTRMIGNLIIKFVVLWVVTYHITARCQNPEDGGSMDL